MDSHNLEPEGRPANLLGSVVQERYKVVRFLGQGGMGFVYQCDDLRLPGTQWALKEMNVSDPAMLGEIRDSFEREARFLATLRHRSMPIIVDVFSIKSFQYLVMEYVDGLDLRQQMDKDGPPQTSVALSWALELAQLLDYLHRQKKPVIFRDLKPENVMLSSDGHIKVIDFGLARHFEPEKRRDTQSSGTVGYTAPEQWEDGEQSDSRVDIYSLGATLYFLLTGKAPGPLYGNVNLRKHCPDIEPQIEALVQRCMAVSPDDRFSSAGELITNLLGILSSSEHQAVIHQHMDAVALNQEKKRRQTASPQKLPMPKRLKAPLRQDKRLPQLLVFGLALFLMGVILPFLNHESSGPAPVYVPHESAHRDDNRALKDEIRESIAHKRYPEAISKLDALITKHPEDAEAHILKNNAYALMTGEEVYRIPAISSWQGREWEGFDALFGWALAQAQLNRERRSRHPVIYLELFNDRSESERLLSIVNDLADDRKVSLVLGPWSSQQALLVAPIANKGNLPIITPVASDPRVLPSGPTMFCVADTDINKTRALAEQLYKSGRRKAALFADRGRYVSRAVAGVFSETFEELGGEIVLQEAYTSEDLEAPKLATQAKERGADCVFIADYRVDPIVALCTALKGGDWKGAIASSAPVYLDELVEYGGRNVEGLYLSTTYLREPLHSRQKSFSESFQTAFRNRHATHREAQVYDSLALAVDALDHAGPDREKVLEYLTSIGRDSAPYSGVSGEFAPSRRLNSRPVHVLQISQGQYRPVEP